MRPRIIISQMLFLCLVSFLLCSFQWVHAEPYVDTGFTNKSPADDVDLIVVRERFDSTTYRQALYFRVFHGQSGMDSVGGTISFSPGITIEAVYYDRYQGDPDSKDMEWAIEADYSGGYRDLETVESNDYVKIDTPKDLSFQLNFIMGVDDFRVIIDYGDQFPNGAYFEISLFEGTNSSWVGDYSPGIQVGNIAGDVPGSGDLGEVVHAKIPLTPGTPQ